MGRIIKVREGITWEEFCIEYAGFFPISNKFKREQAMAASFKELTGRDPLENVKVKKPRKQASTGNSGKAGERPVKDNTEA